MSIIAFDSHKRYTFARVENEDGGQVKDNRLMPAGYGTNRTNGVPGSASLSLIGAGMESE